MTSKFFRECEEGEATHEQRHTIDFLPSAVMLPDGGSIIHKIQRPKVIDLSGCIHIVMASNNYDGLEPIQAFTSKTKADRYAELAIEYAYVEVVPVGFVWDAVIERKAGKCESLEEIIALLKSANEILTKEAKKQ